MTTILDRLIDRARQAGLVEDFIKCRRVWTVTRYASREDYEARRAYSESKVEHNLLLNEGISALLNLLTGAAETAYSNANSYLGVGDSNTAAAATQTGLQAATNKTFIAMEATYPQISAQTVTWRAVFDTGDANYNWREFTVVNGNSDAADNLNRVVSDQGTKASGQVWTLDVSLTIS